jgi:hypothetical protein
MPVPISLNALLQMKFMGENSIIGSGLLNQGAILIIGGPPKSYKSFILNSIAYHLATGTNLFGVTRKDKHDKIHEVFPIAKPQRILILDQEIGFQDLQDRFHQLLAAIPHEHQELCLKNIFFHSCDNSMQLDNTTTGIGHIASLIRSCEPNVVAFDPLIEFHTGDENSSQDMARAFRGLDTLREIHHFATIINHHMSKPARSGNGERTGPDNLRGSSVIYGKGDSILTLRADGRAYGKVYVQFKLRRGRPLTDLVLQVNQDTLLTTFMGWKEGKERD